MAGHFAGKIKAKKLVLTHFSQRYRGVNASTTTTTSKADDCDPCVRRLVKQAEKIFTSGSVFAAEDFMVLQLPLK